MTLLCGGRLVAVLGSKEQNDLQVQLNEKFGELEQIVNSLDSRSADATGEEDRAKIFGAIETLPGGFDELDENIQMALRQWLANAAEGVRARFGSGELLEGRTEIHQIHKVIDDRTGFHHAGPTD